MELNAERIHGTMSSISGIPYSSETPQCQALRVGLSVKIMWVQILAPELTGLGKVRFFIYEKCRLILTQQSYRED